MSIRNIRNIRNIDRYRNGEDNLGGVGSVIINVHTGGEIMVVEGILVSNELVYTWESSKEELSDFEIVLLTSALRRHQIALRRHQIALDRATKILKKLNI